MSESAKKLVIIDGKSVFYRGYYAMPGLSTTDGTPTGGVFGFASMALEVIKRLKPDYVCVAWDKPKTNIRKRLELYPDYKAGRKPAPPDFYVQIPILHNLLEAFNWPLYEIDDYEADDIMATLAKKAGEQGIHTVLVGSDMDMLQCISPTTTVFVLKKGLSSIEELTPTEFEQKYGITVDQFVDLKSLKGDSSDNIPGVPGIGEKTAIDLLQKYESLDGVYENLWQIKGAVATKLEAGKDMAYLSQKLVKLMTDAPVPLDLKNMAMEEMDPYEVQEVLRKLEFRSLVRQLPDVMKAAHKTLVDTSEDKAEVKANGIKMPELLEWSKDVKFTERVYMQAWYGADGSIATIGLLSAGKAYLVTASIFESIGLRNVTGYDVKRTLKKLSPEYLAQFGKLFDVQIAAFMLNSIIRDQTLAGLAREFLDLEIEAEDTTPEQKMCVELATIEALHKSFTKQFALPELAKLKMLFDDIEMPVIPVLAQMERDGVTLDKPYFAAMSESLGGKISDIEQTIYGYADQEFNISSPAQLADILFEKLQLPTFGMKKGKNGAYSTAADVLDKLKDLHPIVKCIGEYREYTKLKNTYVDPLPTMTDEYSRLHTTFNMTVAQTGRLSSADPNLQNIPVRTEIGREIRTGFVADPGCVFVSADYSQFEIRLAAVLAGDADMIEAFNSDIDIHTLTASQVFGVALEDVTKDMRYQAKAVNFGILYGQTAHGLSAGTGMSFAEAREFIEAYFAKRQALVDYIKATRDKAVNDGYVETLFGRRRPTPDVRSSNYMVREGAFRQAVNMPIQGTEADLMKKAMVDLEAQFVSLRAGEGVSKRGGSSNLLELPRQLLQIHDSILVECAEADADKVGELMKKTMEDVYPELGIKLKVDVSIGKNWGEL